MEYKALSGRAVITLEDGTVMNFRGTVSVQVQVERLQHMSSVSGSRRLEQSVEVGRSYELTMEGSEMEVMPVPAERVVIDSVRITELNEDLEPLRRIKFNKEA